VRYLPAFLDWEAVEAGELMSLGIEEMFVVGRCTRRHEGAGVPGDRGGGRTCHRHRGAELLRFFPGFGWGRGDGGLVPAAHEAEQLGDALVEADGWEGEGLVH